jgi:signal transduction histidine kinase/integral membrane sensor domain MASE1
MSRLRALGIGAALFFAYVLAATIGFDVASVAEQVTTVWAPTGLAQAALLLWGRALWPAVWLGAFAVNATTHAPLWTAASIATGNTLEAFVAAWFLTHVIRFDPAFRRTRDSVAFIVVASGLTPVISATIGVVTLAAAGVQPWAAFPVLWSAWFLGDSIGALLVGPVVLTMIRAAAGRTRRSWIETAALVVGTALVVEAVFGQWIGAAVAQHPVEYVIFPLLVTAAVRQGQPATALVALAGASVAISNTVRGFGPFAGAPVHESLILLQLFMGVVGVTGLLLAAAIMEREISERRRAAAHVVSEILASAPTLPEAASRIVRGICENLNWSHGAVWTIDDERPQLRCIAAWPRTGVFAAATIELRFAAGVGLPGRVWSSREPAWIENVVDDGNFPRAGVARAEGLHSAFAFPIRAGDAIYGVLEFFNRSIVAPDADLLATMGSTGNQLGQFVVRTQVEAAMVRGQQEREQLLQRELAARRDAEAANRAKDEFLATLSHELRTPLNAIVGWTRMLLEGTLTDDKRKHALDVIARNAQLQAQLVGDILDVSGIITGGLKLNRAVADLNAVIEAAVDALRPAALAKGLSIEAHVPLEPQLIEGDAPRLQQVVWNLVANAIKFTPAGGHIDVDLHLVAGGGVRIIVRDTGDGIDREHGAADQNPRHFGRAGLWKGNRKPLPDQIRAGFRGRSHPRAEAWHHRYLH